MSYLYKRFDYHQKGHFGGFLHMKNVNTANDRSPLLRKETGDLFSRLWFTAHLGSYALSG